MKFTIQNTPKKLKNYWKLQAKANFVYIALFVFLTIMLILEAFANIKEGINITFSIIQLVAILIVTPLIFYGYIKLIFNKIIKKNNEVLTYEIKDNCIEENKFKIDYNFIEKIVENKNGLLLYIKKGRSIYIPKIQVSEYDKIKELLKEKIEEKNKKINSITKKFWKIMFIGMFIIFMIISMLEVIARLTI